MRLVFLLLSMAAAMAARAESVSCRNVRFLASVQQVGSPQDPIYIPVYQSSDYTIEVEPSQKGTYGYVAHTQTSAATPATDVFDVQVVSQTPDQQSQVETMAHIMIPTLDYSRVTNIVYADVGVEANAKQDASGSAIFVLEAADGSVLGRIAKIGWGYGLCSSDYPPPVTGQ